MAAIGRRLLKELLTVLEKQTFHTNIANKQSHHEKWRKILPCTAVFARHIHSGDTRSTVPISPEQQYAEAQNRNIEAGPLLELVRDFLNPADVYNTMRNLGIDFFCGVPDSLLKDICGYITANTPEQQHIITANEGSAIALAAGYHLATGKFGLVYLQNSGLGNIVNPIMSMASPGVYSIPMLLLVGWRGEPGKRDEPQHMIQGQATPNMLASMGIPVQPLPDYQDGAEKALMNAKQHMETSGGPYCLLVKRQTFSPYKLPRLEPQYELGREDAIKLIIDALGPYDVTVGTTGQTSRELFEYRVEKGHGHEKDFLTVGSMGHAPSIAMGIAMHKPSRQVFCIDGDGAAIMHMGTMASIGTQGPKKLETYFD